MGRRRTPQEKRELGERARALRAAGRSRREIQAELGIGDDLAKAFLRGVPLPDSLARPRAKDSDREAAREMRAAGSTYDEIAAELGVSKSTCSLWLRDLPHPAGATVEVPPEGGAAVSGDPRHEQARDLRAQGLTAQPEDGPQERRGRLRRVPRRAARAVPDALPADRGCLAGHHGGAADR